MPLTLLAVGAIIGALAFYDARKVRQNLVQARQTLQNAVDDPATLRTPAGRESTGRQLRVALDAVERGRAGVTDSLAMSLFRFVPGLSHQRSGLLTLIDDSRQAAETADALLTKAGSLAQRNQLTDGKVPLDGVRELSGEVRTAAATMGRLAHPDAGLWGPLGDARRELDDLAVESASRLSGAADALDAARTFMGGEDGRRYLVAVQNNAEMRDQGMVLSYVVIRFSGGNLTFEANGSVADLRLDRGTSTPLPAGTNEVFGFIEPTRIWQSVNATADFALSGRIMADMYRQATGQSVDGVIAVDVPALAALLRVLGPVSVTGIAEPITSENASRILLHDLYEGLPPLSDPSNRRERLGDVTRSIVDRITTGSRDVLGLGKELGDAAAGGHLRLWSSRTGEEDLFEQTGLAGGPGVKDADRTIHVAVQNRTATKLDYYVQASMKSEIEVTPAGAAIVRTTVMVDNKAPVGAPPSYQLGPDAVTKRPGDYIAWVLLWGPAGSNQLQGGIEESGLNLSQRVIDVPAGERRAVTFETVIPGAVRDGELELRFVPQARLVPMAAEVTLSAHGWRVGGQSPIWTGALDQVRTLTWQLSR